MLLFTCLPLHAATPGGTAARAPLLRTYARPFPPPAPPPRSLPPTPLLHSFPAFAPRSLSSFVPSDVRSTQATAVLARPAELNESAAASSRALLPGAGFPCRDTRAASVHFVDWAGSRAQQSSAAALSSGSTPALQHTCIAGTHALQHTLGRCDVAVDLYPYLQKRGWDGHRPLNGCPQGLVVRGISPPEPCLYTCHTKVLSKVSNSPPIHQYFPAASPYGAQPGGWIGKADCYL